MKSLKERLNEVKGENITSQWINDEKPIMTRDGRQAIKLEVVSPVYVLKLLILWEILRKLMNQMI